MSSSACPALYALVQAGPAVPVEPAAQVGEPPTPEDLLAAVGHVFACGWVRARAGQMGLERDLDDAAQTTFLRAWQARDHYDPGYPLASWVGGIARNVLIDLARARARRRLTSLYDGDGGQRIDPPCRQPAALDSLVAQETSQRLEAALAGAPPLVRDILALKEQGLTFAAIAQRLGRSQAAVVSTYHRFKVATLHAVAGE